MSRRKLLYIINHIDWFWSHRLPLAKGAQAEGWDVHVAVTGAAQGADLNAQNFTGHDLPDTDQGPLSLIQVIWGIHKIIKAERPEVVHAITLKYAFLCGLAARFHNDVHVVHTLAGLGYLFSADGAKPRILRALIGPFLKLALKGPRIRLIFQNPDDMALMIRRGFAKEAQCTLIRGSGVDLDEFSFTPLPEDDAPIVLMPTRLVHDKGVAVFIEAARLVHHEYPDARFQIAGGLSHNNPRAISKIQMENMIESSPVEWLGKVSDMPALYKSASIICYPSYYGEGVPKVLLEAAAVGRAIITTDHPGCREVVRNGENGFLVPVKDVHATAHALLTVLKDEDLMITMGQKSHALARKDFDVQSVVQRTLKIYDF